VKKKLSLIIFILVNLNVYSGPEGYDYYDSGGYVEFDEDCFHEGDSLYMFDYATSEYHSVSIEDMDCYQDGCEIEIYDYAKGSYRYIDLEDDICS
jgi:hypothetical protein